MEKEVDEQKEMIETYKDALKSIQRYTTDKATYDYVRKILYENEKSTIDFLVNGF